MKHQKLIKESTQIYNNETQANETIIIFQCNKLVYLLNETSKIDYRLLRIEKDYRSNKANAKKLRFRINKATKLQWIKTNNLQPIMTIEEYKNNAKINKLNLGEYAEKYVCDMLNVTYTRNNVPFYISGDVNVGNRRIQVKYENATLCSLATLEKLINSK